MIRWDLFKMKRKVIIVVVTIGIIVLGGGTIFATNYNKYSLKTDAVKVELGNSLETNLKETLISGTKEGYKNTSLDLSEVNLDKPGEYKAYAKNGDKVLTFTILVEDSVKPVVIVKAVEESTIFVGQELVASDYVKSVQDIGGIKNIKLSEGDKTLVEGTDLEQMRFSFDSNGVHKVEVASEDISGNVGKESFEVSIKKDYITKINGFKDLSVQEGGSIDWMEGISYLEDIKSVDVNSSGVDLNTPGDYKLIYSINCDDGTVLTREVNVSVTAKPKTVAQPSTSSGGSSSSSGGSVSTPSSSGGGSSGGSTSSGYNKDGTPRTTSVTGGVIPDGMAAWGSNGVLYFPGETVSQYQSRTGVRLMGVTPDKVMAMIPDWYVIGTDLIVTNSKGLKFNVNNPSAGYIN